MSETRTSRGRPKGTGLDDHARLLAIAKLIAGNPNLKPTTAIKNIGITDPSAIRRLRDKFHAVGDSLMSEAHASPSEPAARSIALQSASAPVKSAAPQPKSRPAAAVVTETETGDNAPAELSAAPAAPLVAESRVEAVPSTPISAPVACAVPEAATSQASAAAGTAAVNPAQWMALWYGIGLQSFSTAVGFQISFVEKMMRMPHVATALRGQVALNELAVAFVAPRGAGAKVLH